MLNLCVPHQNDRVKTLWLPVVHRNVNLCWFLACINCTHKYLYFSYHSNELNTCWKCIGACWLCPMIKEIDTNVI